MQERRAERTKAYSATEVIARLCNQLDNMKATLRVLAEVIENQAERLAWHDEVIAGDGKPCS